MNDVSVVIPTLQNNKYVLKLLIEELNRDISVSEIILIDNSRQGFDFDSKKLKVVIPSAESNLYVNQSWNLGVEIAKEKYYALFNDDLLVCENFCSKVLNLITKIDDFGCIGMSDSSVENTDIKCYPDETIFNVVADINERLFNWGTIIFGKKEFYDSIPGNIKVWAGDDYIRYTTRRYNKNIYKLENALIYHLGGLSSKNSKLTKIKYNDVMNMGKVFPEFKKEYAYKETQEKIIKQKLQIFKNIFSIRNSDDRTHKIITILWIKIKIKRHKYKH